MQCQPNIQLRVKTCLELMHEKLVMVDENIIRDGSGNWSVSAARYQDSEITVSSDPEEIRAFQQGFAEMWAPPTIKSCSKTTSKNTSTPLQEQKHHAGGRRCALP